MKRVLCALGDVRDGGAKGLCVNVAGAPQEIFLVRRGTQVFGYVNRCPHTGAPLDWVPDQFLTVDGSLIQCANHDARFRIEDGGCVQGPCHGRSLTPVPVLVLDGHVLIRGDPPATT